METLKDPKNVSKMPTLIVEEHCSNVSEKPINKNFPFTEYIQQSSNNSYVSEPEETSLTEISDIWQSNSSKLIEITKLILVKPWIPPTTYAFPIIEQNKKKRKLKFQYKWLTTYNWLVYSELQEGAFCKFCLVFATNSGIGQQKSGALTLTAFINWKKSKEAFNDHSNYDYHKVSVAKAEWFLNIYSNK
ncbi:zinc finger MYM-type protein 1-like [Aphis craccivora]|uniref:Zinc finger MYM-type protein 1-like n=1 Tax=Aphis craccivora TaxID=307492 RepID=A0A6G0Y8Z7_APHCR|nr:zinc finger MYM-type protein 1-like [Aphis craccivora]